MSKFRRRTMTFLPDYYIRDEDRERYGNETEKQEEGVSCYHTQKAKAIRINGRYSATR